MPLTAPFLKNKCTQIVLKITKLSSVMNSTTLKLSNGSVRASQVALVVKHLPANSGDIRDMGSISGSGRSPGGEHGNPLQYSCLVGMAHGLEKSQTRLRDLACTDL